MKRLFRSKSNLSQQEMKDMVRNNDNVILLDVRSPQEFEEGHLDGAINIPTYEIYSKAQKILTDKDAIIIAYCTLGVRSKNVIKILKKMGYKNLYHLDCGIG